MSIDLHVILALKVGIAQPLLHVTLAKKMGIAQPLLHVTLARTKEVATSSFPGIAKESAVITTGSLSRKTDVFENKWEVAGDVPGKDFSLNDYKSGVCLKLLSCEGFMVNGSKGILAFDVEKRNWRQRNSFVGKLLQLLQFFRDLPSAAISSNLLEIAVFKNFKYCIHRAFYEILVEKLFARFLSSAIVILFLFEYLMGYIERGGWATYSDTSWEFRATYVSIELRLAAYFWFKFRSLPTQIPSADRGQKRSRSELKRAASISKKSNKFEPKLKTYLPIEGKRVKRDVWLGGFNTYQEAEIVYWIGACYYDEQDRLSDELLSWLHKLELPPLPPNLSVKEKASWVRETANEYRTGSRHHDQGLVAVEQCLAQRYVAEVTSGTSEGDLFPIEDIVQNSEGSSGDTEFMLQTNTGRDFLTESTRDSEDFTLDDCIMGTVSIQGEVCGQGVGRAGLNPLGTCPDQSVNNQQDVQHFQLNHGCASALDGGGYVAEVGASFQQDEIEEYHVRRALADHSQAMDLIVAQEVKELKITDEIRFAIRELHKQGWDFEIQPRVSTEFCIAYTVSCEGQGPNLTGANCLAFDEIHKQGFKIILKPLNIALPQVSSQAMDIIVAQDVKKLIITDTIRFIIWELHKQGWDFEIQPRVSTEFSITYTISCEGQGPKLTGANCLAFDEIHKQGFKIILKPLNIALPQVSNGEPQGTTPVSLKAGMWRPQSGSRGLCRSCDARLFAE